MTVNIESGFVQNNFLIIAEHEKVKVFVKNNADVSKNPVTICIIKEPIFIINRL
ncbi:hypothetical protein [Candidatus Nitrosocosmicus sp. T]